MVRSVAQAAKPAAASGGSDAARAAWALLIQLVKEVKGRQLAELDLTPAQAHLLLSIETGRPGQMSDLANHLGCDASNVTGLVDRLEARGLIERRADPDDRRVKMVALTARGVKLQAKVREQWYEPPEVLRALDAADQAELLEILKRATST